MSVTCLCLKKLDVSRKVEELHAELLYPKLVIFEDYQNFRIVDLNTKEETSNSDLVFNFEHEILDKTLQDHLLWIILKSGEIVITDIIKGTQAKIKLDNYTKYQINRLQNVDQKVYFFSEGGECLHAPLSVQELDERIITGASEITLNLEKTRLRSVNPERITKKQQFDDLYLLIENGDIIAECPITGLQETISTDVKIEHIVPWDELVIFSCKEQMWAVNLRESNVYYKFANIENSGNYYPLAVHNNGLYFLVWDKLEVIFISLFFLSSLHYKFITQSMMLNFTGTNLLCFECLHFK